MSGYLLTNAVRFDLEAIFNPLLPFKDIDGVAKTVRQLPAKQFYVGANPTAVYRG